MVMTELELLTDEALDERELSFFAQRGPLLVADSVGTEIFVGGSSRGGGLPGDIAGR